MEECATPIKFERDRTDTMETGERSLMDAQIGGDFDPNKFSELQAHIA